MLEDIKNLKVVLLGDPGCGKTSIVNRFINNTFDPNQESTIGANYFSKIMNKSNASIKVNIWDIAGRERYEGLATLYAKQADAYLIVCQYNQNNSGESIQRYYDKFVKDNIRDDTQLFLVVNKSDLKSSHSESGLEDVEVKADEFMVGIYKISAKHGVGIDEMFDKLCEKLVKHSVAMNRISVNLTSSQKNPSMVVTLKKKKCC